MKYKTSEEWFEDYKSSNKDIKSEIQLLDPDGWRQKNKPCNFYKDLITKEDFTQRIVISTLSWKNI